MADLVVLRRALGWQAPRYDSWLQCGTLPLVNLRSGEFIFFAYDTTAGLVPMVFSFLHTLLEFYGLQLQQLSLHSFILVVILIHLCVR
jgi:hypothetical protein